YRDKDGDNVTVTFSRAFLTAGNVNTVFTFDAGTVDGSNATGQQLQKIALSGLAPAGINVTTSAIRSATGGDGFAALDEIAATGLDLGVVTLDGDLGRILAGNNTLTTPGLMGLKVLSLGRYGTATGAADLNSVVMGRTASLSVKTDVKEAF